MPSTKKRPQSPTIDEPPQKRSKRTTQAQIVSPKRRKRGSKDQRLYDLQKLECTRRLAVFTSRPSELSTAQPIRSTTAGIGRAIATTADPRPRSPNRRSPSPVTLHSPPPIFINDDSFVFDGSNNTPGASRTGSQTPPGDIRNNRTTLRQTNHLDAVTPTWNTRRSNQATQWKSVIIPKLIPVYLANRAKTKSGRTPPPLKPPHLCQCSTSALKVDLMTWDCTYSSDSHMGCSLTHIPSGCSHQILSVCECYPASVQLVEMGYFPCAPVRPTLTFDINLLELVTIASHHMAPNVTGWSSSLQEFLLLRGYLLGEKVCGTVRTVNSIGKLRLT